MSHEVDAGMGGNGGNDNDAESDRRRCRVRPNFDSFNLNATMAYGPFRVLGTDQDWSLLEDGRQGDRETTANGVDCRAGSSP